MPFSDEMRQALTLDRAKLEALGLPAGPTESRLLTLGRRQLKGPRDPWNRCDVCGKFIAYADFDAKSAVRLARRTLAFPDSMSAMEDEHYETYCPRCNSRE